MTALHQLISITLFNGLELPPHTLIPASPLHSCSPNTITLIGLLVQVSALAFAYTLAPSFEISTSPWAPYAAVWSAASLFIYSTLDNMDGKHARRTGSSSPLGLLFDHGCDAINAGMVGWAIFALQTGSGADSWTTFVFWIMKG
jgi:ethanolaminephosphotransferase